MFLLFVAIASLFWCIVSLNDSVTETFRVRLNIINVPDSVTFITDPPAEIHVTLRDKGTNILRSGVVKHPSMEINFMDYASDGVFRMTSSELNSELKADLGTGSTVTNVSLDSLRLLYTGEPGKRVPVEVLSDLTAASGYVINGSPRLLTKGVKIYSFGNEIDTVHKVLTQRLVRRNLSQTSEFDVKLAPVRGVKMVPSQVRVRVVVEPLVHKEAYVNVEVRNLPSSESVLLFPNRVPVSFYVPMSRFNDADVPVTVYVDYLDTKAAGGSKLSLHVGQHSPQLVNLELRADSVEFTLVRH